MKPWKIIFPICLTGFVLFLFLVSVKGLIVGSLITNGDFANFNSTAMNYYNYSYLTETQGSFGWYGQSASCTANCIINDTITCQSLGFTNNCLQLKAQILNKIFTWTSNSSWANLIFYGRSISGTFSPSIWIIDNTGAGCNQDLSNLNTGNCVAGTNFAGHGQNNNFAFTTTVQRFSANYTNFIQGHNYLILFVNNGNLYMGNITLFAPNTSALAITMTAPECNKYYSNSTTYINSTISCETGTIDTTNCISVQNVIGTNTIGVWDYNGLCYDTSVFHPFSLAFNTSNTYVTFNQACNDYFLGMKQSYQDTNLNPYYNNSGVFATCYYPYTNISFAPNFIACDLQLDCYLNISILNQDCSAVCINGYIYLNGTYDTSLNTCDNFQSAQKCDYGCNSLTSCSGLAVSSANNTLPSITTPSQSTNVLYSILFSPFGYGLIITLVFSYTSGILIAEDLGLVVMLIFEVLFSFYGVFGLASAYAGLFTGSILGLNILNRTKSGDKK